MTKAIIVLASILALTGAASAAPSMDPTKPNNGISDSVTAVSLLPCKDFTRNPDGSWTYAGTFYIGTSAMTRLRSVRAVRNFGR